MGVQHHLGLVHAPPPYRTLVPRRERPARAARHRPAGRTEPGVRPLPGPHVPAGRMRRLEAKALGGEMPVERTGHRIRLLVGEGEVGRVEQSGGVEVRPQMHRIGTKKKGAPGAGGPLRLRLRLPHELGGRHVVVPRGRIAERAERKALRRLHLPAAVRTRTPRAGSDSDAGNAAAGAPARTGRDGRRPASPARAGEKPDESRQVEPPAHVARECRRPRTEEARRVHHDLAPPGGIHRRGAPPVTRGRNVRPGSGSPALRRSTTPRFPRWPRSSATPGPGG